MIVYKSIRKGFRISGRLAAGRKLARMDANSGNPTSEIRLQSVYAGGMRICVAALLALTLWMPWAQAAKKASANGEYFVYIGTYTGTSKGIYAYRFHPADGKLTSIGLVAETTNPSFLAIHPNGRSLYAVNEVDTLYGEKAGGVSAFRIDPRNGKLIFLNTVSSKGAGPCHLLVDKTGKNLLG